LALALGLGEVLGVGVVRAPLAADVAVLDGGRTSGPGPWLAKYRASGTTIMPRMTVKMKVTAPHSRRTKTQFTRDEV
jgi:hypothetical protein